MYKVTATSKQSLPKQALWLRMKAEQSNENVRLTVQGVLMVQFLHKESGFTFQSSPGKGTVCLVRNHGPSTLY